MKHPKASQWVTDENTIDYSVFVDYDDCRQHDLYREHGAGGRDSGDMEVCTGEKRNENQ